MDVVSSKGWYNERNGVARRGRSFILAQSTRQQSRDPVHGTSGGHDDDRARYNNLIQLVNLNIDKLHILLHEFDHLNLHHHHGPEHDDILLHDDECPDDHHAAVLDKLYGSRNHDHDGPGDDNNVNLGIRLDHDNPYGHDAAGNWQPGD